MAQTTDTQWRHKSKKSENLDQCGRQNMLRPHLKIWEWELIFGRAVKAISSPGVCSPWSEWKEMLNHLWWLNYVKHQTFRHFQMLITTLTVCLLQGRRIWGCQGGHWTPKFLALIEVKTFFIKQPFCTTGPSKYFDLPSYLGPIKVRGE